MKDPLCKHLIPLSAAVVALTVALAPALGEEKDGRAILSVRRWRWGGVWPGRGFSGPRARVRPRRERHDANRCH